MTREDIARAKARDIVQLTLEENPHTPAFVLSERAIDTFLGMMASEIVRPAGCEDAPVRGVGCPINIQAFQNH